MSPWQPLSVRSGTREPFAMEEGTPPHLQAPLLSWIEEQFRSPGGWDDEDAARDAAVALHIAVTHPLNTNHDVVGAAREDDSVFLDLLDFFLDYHDGRDAKRLDDLLTNGHSVWRVDDSGKALTRRVTDASLAAYQMVQSAADVAAAELSEAWEKAYGVRPDPSDAWDHAIKAVEAALGPVVVPNAPKPTLGSMISALDVPGKWYFALPGIDLRNGEQPLVVVLRMIWPNPDRHGAGKTNRPPSQDEAETVVQLATTVVQWLRAGALRLR